MLRVSGVKLRLLLLSANPERRPSGGRGWRTRKGFRRSIQAGKARYGRRQLVKSVSQFLELSTCPCFPMLILALLGISAAL